jgi:hypothetical protein
MVWVWLRSCNGRAAAAGETAGLIPARVPGRCPPLLLARRARSALDALCPRPRGRSCPTVPLCHPRCVALLPALGARRPAAGAASQSQLCDAPCAALLCLQRGYEATLRPAQAAGGPAAAGSFAARAMEGFSGRPAGFANGAVAEAGNGGLFSSGGNGGGGGGFLGAMGAATGAGGALGSAKNPIYMMQAEPTFWSQMWRSVRVLGLAFLFMAGGWLGWWR